MVPFGLMSSALLLGLVSSPHCVAMCGAACLGVRSACGGRGPGDAALLGWHVGRGVGYALAGAVAAGVGGSMLWAGDRLPAIRSLWVLAHALAFAWGLALLVRGRAPEFGARVGRRVGDVLRRSRRPWLLPLSIGLSWALLPCGMLYSALMLAALSGAPMAGAQVMLAFAVGSGVALGVLPWVWPRLRPRSEAAWRPVRFDGAGMSLQGGPIAVAGRPVARALAGESLANRAGGVVLLAMSGWALWSDVAGRGGPWCG